MRRHAREPFGNRCAAGNNVFFDRLAAIEIALTRCSCEKFPARMD
jgi:hypothetical protein